jgi:hypothetical protein
MFERVKTGGLRTFLDQSENSTKHVTGLRDGLKVLLPILNSPCTDRVFSLLLEPACVDDDRHNKSCLLPLLDKGDLNRPLQK